MSTPNKTITIVSTKTKAHTTFAIIGDNLHAITDNTNIKINTHCDCGDCDKDLHKTLDLHITKLLTTGVFKVVSATSSEIDSLYLMIYHGTSELPKESSNPTQKQLAEAKSKVKGLFEQEELTEDQREQILSHPLGKLLVSLFGVKDALVQSEEAEPVKTTPEVAPTVGAVKEVTTESVSIDNLDGKFFTTFGCSAGHVCFDLDHKFIAKNVENGSVRLSEVGGTVMTLHKAEFEREFFEVVSQNTANSLPQLRKSFPKITDDSLLKLESLKSRDFKPVADMVIHTNLPITQVINISDLDVLFVYNGTRLVRMINLAWGE